VVTAAVVVSGKPFGQLNLKTAEASHPGLPFIARSINNGRLLERHHVQACFGLCSGFVRPWPGLIRQQSNEG
jgi:hypothetical protein